MDMFHFTVKTIQTFKFEPHYQVFDSTLERFRGDILQQCNIIMELLLILNGIFTNESKTYTFYCRLLREAHA